MIDPPPQLPHDLANKIQRSLAVLGEPQRPGEGRLIGPFRHVSSLAPAFLHGIGALEQIGWRGPIVRDGQPIATVSLGDGENGGISVRGGDAARAFVAALEVAVAEAGSNPRARIRFVTLRDLFIRAVWLKLPRHSLWVPTRLGSERVQPKAFATRQFKTEVRRRLHAAALSPGTARAVDAAMAKTNTPPGGNCSHVRHHRRIVSIAEFREMEWKRSH